MTHAAYVFGGYLLTAGVLGTYVAWILRRTRTLRQQLSTPGGEGPGESG